MIYDYMILVKAENSFVPLCCAFVVMRSRDKYQVIQSWHALRNGASLDWLLWKITGNHGFYYQKWVFPVNFPNNQHLEWDVPNSSKFIQLQAGGALTSPRPSRLHHLVWRRCQLRSLAATAGQKLNVSQSLRLDNSSKKSTYSTQNPSCIMQSTLIVNLVWKNENI